MRVEPVDEESRPASGTTEPATEPTELLEPREPWRESAPHSPPPPSPPQDPIPPAASAPALSHRVVPWLVAGLVTIVVAAASFTFGRLSAESPAPAASTPISTSLTAPPTTAPPTPEPSSPTTQAPRATQPPIVIEGDVSEPAAAVAAAVGPAVVQIELAVGVGSGVIYDADGLILTAAHVVQNAANVRVRLANGLRVSGEVVGAHTPTDVAVVKIDPLPDLPVATLGVDVEPVVGQRAIALGSPFGLDQTVTSGIVSALNRDVNGVGMIQTDAAINPGNSGGPLVDRNGRVIGINDAIRTQSGANDGVGFAIPIDLAYIVAEQLVEGVDVELARLGVAATGFNDGMVGALVSDVTPGSAAEEAGILVGDLITAVDGAPISDSSDLRAEILSEFPGTEIELTIVRNDEVLTLTATLGAAGFAD